MLTKNVIDEYTTYIDNAQMIIEYYKNKKTTGLEKYFLKIEEWLNRDISGNKNMPLVIEADEGVGKKTLLVQWMEYHQQKSQKSFKDIIIPHFAGTGGNNSNYYYAIYKILIKLREAFNVSQKVELLEDKLRRYFHYWLNVCSSALKSQVVNDSTIILVFEGMNLFTDFDTGLEANVALWLPQIFPDRIRVIVTCETGTMAMKHFETIGSEIIKIVGEPILHQTLIDGQIHRPTFVIDETYKERVISILQNKPAETLKSSLYIKTYLATILPYPSDNIIKDSDIDKNEFKKVYQNMDFQKLESINDVSSLNSFVLDFYSKNICQQDKYKKAMSAMTLTEKGLSVAEIFLLTKLNLQEWNNLIAVFKTFFMKYKGLWKINNETFKKAVMSKYLDDPQYTTNLYLEIAEVLNKTPNSIRKLEEQTYHLFMSKSYFKLKEVVANIENFLLLFNSNNKYDLCRYWQLLEQQGFDPTSEYNKGIEGFEMHYRPNPEDTFMIGLQVSRFLKEFSDFETNFTPEFRHPPIKGGKELKEIGLRHEIKKMNMYLSEEWEDEDEELDEIEELEHELAKEFTEYSEDQLKKLAKEIYTSSKPNKKRVKSPRKFDKTDESAGSDINSPGKIPNGKSKSQFIEFLKRQKENNTQPKILEEIEALNVDIPENREKFREFFSGLMKAEAKLIQEADNAKYMDAGELPPEDELKLLQKKETGDLNALLNKEKETQVGIIKKNKNARYEVDPTFYYYKRWLWLMFPWVCLSFKNNYSKIISECFSSATKYMSVQDEREKTMQALKIAIEAKLKKQLVYSKESNLANQLSRSAKAIGKKAGGSTTRLSQDASMNNTKLSTTKLTTGRPMELDNLTMVSPTHTKSLTTKAKKKEFFITQELLNPIVLNQSLNFSRLDTIPDIKQATSPTNESTLQSMSLLNRSKAYRENVNNLSYAMSERKLMNMVQNAAELTANLSVLRFNDSVQTYSSRQIGELEGKVAQLHREFDELAFANKNLAHKLKEMKVTEINLGGSGAGSEVAKAQERLNQLNDEMQKAMKALFEAQKQGHRLTKIIDICDKNKKSDQLWIRNLNYLLQNIKKMIGWEQESIKKDGHRVHDLNKLSQEFVRAFQEKKENQIRLIHHVNGQRNRKDQIDQNLEEVYTHIERTAFDTVDRIKENSHATKKALKESQRFELLERKNKNVHEKKEELYHVIEKIRDSIGLDFESEQFQHFLDSIGKMNELKSTVYEKEDEISKIKEDLEYKKSYLETLKKAKGGLDNFKKPEPSQYDSIESKDELTKILAKVNHEKEMTNGNLKRLTSRILNAKMILGNISKKFGVDQDLNKIEDTDIHEEEFLTRVEERLQSLKESLGAEDFEKFQKGELDMHQHQPKLDLTVKISKTITEGDEASSTPRVGLYKKGGKIVEFEKRMK